MNQIKNVLKTVAAIIPFVLLFCIKDPTSPTDKNLVDELQRTGSISGHVYEHETTKGIFGVNVVAKPGGYATTTDSSGHYRIPDVRVGAYELSFVGEKHLDTTIDDVSIVVDQNLVELNVFLKKYLCKFMGTLMDGRTGVKIAGATVTAVSEEAVSFTSVSDTSGSYVLNIIPGVYTVTVMHDDYLPQTVTEIVVTKGQNVYPFNQSLQSKWCLISGNVFDQKTLSAVSGVQVTIPATDYSTATDEAGLFIIRYPGHMADTIDIRFTHALYRDTTVSSLVITQGQPSATMNMFVKAETGSIEGRILDNQTDGGVSGASITIDKLGLTTVSGSDGSYILTHIPEDTYSVSVRHPQYRDTTRHSVAVALAASVTGLDIKLNKLNSSISGQVIEVGTGNPVSGVSVTTGGSGFNTSTDANGMYVLPNIPQGTYTLYFSHPHYIDTSMQDVAISAGEYLINQNMTLRQKLGGIRGAVVNTLTGEPVEGVSLMIMPGGQSTVTTPQGQFELLEVKAGNYKVLCSKEGYYPDSLVGVDVSPGQLKEDLVLQIRQFDVQITIAGALSGNTGEVKTVTVTVTGDSIAPNNPVHDTLGWFGGDISSYNGKTSIPLLGIRWSAEIRVFDANARMIGYRQYDGISRVATTFMVPAFNCRNATPHVRISSAAQARFGDTVAVSFSAADSFSSAQGPVADVYSRDLMQLSFKAGDGDFVPLGNLDTSIVLPSTAQDYPLVLRALDQDMNLTHDTLIITVLQDLPLVSLGPDTTVGIDETLQLSAATSQKYGRIVQYEWDLTDDGVFDTTVLASAAMEYVPRSEGAFRIIAQVTDDKGQTARDTINVTVVNLAPVIVSIRPDTTVYYNKPMRFCALANDPDGQVVSYSWDFDGNGTYDFTSEDSAGAMYAFADSGTYTARLRVVDNHNKISSKDVIVTVTRIKYLELGTFLSKPNLLYEGLEGYDGTLGSGQYVVSAVLPVDTRLKIRIWNGWNYPTGSMIGLTYSGYNFSERYGDFTSTQTGVVEVPINPDEQLRIQVWENDDEDPVIDKLVSNSNPTVRLMISERIGDDWSTANQLYDQEHPIKDSPIITLPVGYDRTEYEVVEWLISDPAAGTFLPQDAAPTEITSLQLNSAFTSDLRVDVSVMAVLRQIVK